MILPLYLPALLLSVAAGLLLPVLPLYAQSFHASVLIVGLVVAGDGIGLLIGDIPSGFVLRRIDRRSGMTAGIALQALAALAMFWAGSIPVVLLLRMLSGLGAALYNVARVTYVAETITVASRGRSVALLGGTFRIGRMVGPLIGGAMAAAAGLRAPFLAYAAICGLAAATILIFNRGTAVTGIQPAAEGVSLAAMIATARRHARLLLAPGAGHFLIQMVRAGPPVIIPLYASSVLGLGVEQIGYVFSAASAIDATLFYPTGIIMDRLGRKWAIVPSALVMAAGLALVPFTHSLLGLTVAALINGFGNGLGSGVMITLGADLAPPGERGPFLGLWSLIGDAGISSGPVVVGAVAGALALQPATWVIAAAGVLDALVFGKLVPETLKKE